MADSFDPVAEPEARVLMLGTVPGRESIPYENKLAAWQAVLHPLDCSDMPE
ncbi:MAG: hypothetical protein ACYCZR_14175 [Burkholderiales bacterium]